VGPDAEPHDHSADASTGDPVRYEFEHGRARIVMRRGDEGNPINPAWNRAMIAALGRARRDRARVIELSAEGRFFCVGGDLDAMMGTDCLSEFLDEVADSLHRVVSEIRRAESVVVCSVQGPAAGAGFPLAAAADVLIAGRSASFTLGYTKVGLTVDGGTTLLVDSLGLHRTLRLALLNESLSAEEAERWGLVSSVVDDDDLAAATDALGRQLCSGPAQAQSAVKSLLRQAARSAAEGALRREALELRRQGLHPHALEGIHAFKRKRAPRFAPEANR